MFGIADLSSFSAQPFLIISDEVPVVVGQDDDVAVDRLAARERALDLPEERGVVVDVLGVVDVYAGLLLERVERRVRFVFSFVSM